MTENSIFPGPVNDTIVALATPPGLSAIGMIRLSGPAAISMAGGIFGPAELELQPSHTLHYGTLRDGLRIVDEVVVGIYKAPHSYTGEPIAEISGHGSPYILEQILQLCLRQGARLAEPGEFTRRAFLNGKLDLAQAEAVADLIASRSAAAQRSALHNLRGGFSRKLEALRAQLIQFAALIELELDFSEEDVEFADRSRLYALVDSAIGEVQQLIDSFRLGNVVKQGVSVAIVGPPNAGKSTLLNALLNEERAIVSETAGTTRDTIEESLNINGVLFRLIDTAGIREHTTDTIEQIGMGKSLEKMRSADLVLYLFDVTGATPQWMDERRSALEKENIRYLLIGNKTDLPGGAEAAGKLAGAGKTLLISAKAQENIRQLKDALYKAVTGGEIQPEDTILTNTRHLAALREALASLTAVREGLDAHISADLLTPDIRRCLHFLGEITGVVTHENVLDYIFSQFCIGK
ncbi:tRNA uridine-5-carboxymethylaminomethyl(34) synthesis GTPase MnmE [Compostibacter hankyongensis]|uniref:tRNA modification GTPase MnmE n=1 Tax=Compostibacter hankyongensis TaxID=1007089 RepID=A0ABP8FU85_9BACT